MDGNCKIQLLLLMLAMCWTLSTQSPVQNYTAELLRTAKSAQIMAYLDMDRDPCDNFYKYACGKWHRLQPAGDGKSKTTYLGQLQELYAKKSSEMLKGERSTNTNVDMQLKDFYDSCLHSGQNDEKLNLENLMSVVNFRGGWPEVQSYLWYENGYDWLQVVADVRRGLGVNILVGLEVVPDYEEMDLYRIKVGAPMLKLGSRAAYLDANQEQLRLDYKNKIFSNLQLHFPQMSKTWASEISQSVLELEQQLAKGLPDNPKLTLAQTTRQRYASDLKLAYGAYVDLSRYFNMIFNETIYQKVYETPEEYMTNLMEVIRQTPKLTIANYTMWKVLESFESEGIISAPISENWCIQKVIQYFDHPLENMFHRNYNNMEIINELQSVWSDVKRLFKEELQNSVNLGWMSSDTRQRAKAKLEDMHLEIVGHERENFEPQMRALKISPVQFNQNLIQIMRWKTWRNLAKLMIKPEEAGVEIGVPQYQLRKNKIQIPITFLQSRFFWDASYPTALKYSSLGVLLAQEMMKGFDHVGLKYDRYGYQRNWFDHHSEKTLNEKAECFTNQYSSYKFQGKSISDPNLQSIAVTDNAGLSLAYRAYQNWWSNIDNNEVSLKETLPLLKLTRNQLFFVNFAQLFCSDYDVTTEEYDKIPEHLRVMGVLSNSQAFSQEFQCEEGEKMNPPKKCWIF